MSLANNVYDFNQKIKREDTPVIADLDNGHFRIANDIQDGLCRLSVSGATFQVLHTIIRHTYGWNKKEDKLTNTRIVDYTGLGDRTVRKALDELVERCVISYRKSGHMKLISINTTVSDWQLTEQKNRNKRAGNPAQTCQTNSEQTCRNSGTNVPENRNKRADTKDKRQNTDLPIVPLKNSDSIERIFTHWKTVMNKPAAKLTAERSKKISARLADGYSEETIIRAIDGCAASDFHMGRTAGSRLQYNDFDLICRNGSKLESFAAMPLAKQGDENWTETMLNDTEVLF